MILCLSAISCKTQQSFTPSTFDDAIISFGSGGGFTGKVKSYQLLSNGQFFKSAGTDSNPDEIVSVKERVCAQMFDNFMSLGLMDIQLDDPGNLYKFIRYKKGDENHHIQWGGKNEPVPQKLKDFFRNLNQLANKNKAVLK